MPTRLEYLPPCETPEEQKRKHQQDAYNLIRSEPTPIPAWTPTKGTP